MVRTSTLLALIAGIALTLGLAGSATAITSMDLVWKSNGLTTIGSTSAAPPPSVTALLVMSADTAGVSSLQGEFVFDYLETPSNVFVPDGNELDGRFPYGIENSGPASRVGKGNQFAPLNSSNSTLQESDGLQIGRVMGFESATLGFGCSNCTITLGSALFTTTANSSPDSNPDVVFTLRINGVDTMFDTVGVEIPPSNLSFGSVNVLPEPMAAVFGAAALGSLGLLARRRS